MRRHNEKKYHYRFNVYKDYKGDRIIVRYSLISYLFTFEEVSELLERVQIEKKSKISKYGVDKYKFYMEKESKQNALLIDLKKCHRKDKKMEGLERLEKEVLEMNNYNISVIFNYLKTRKDLYESFNKAEKSIKQMYKFIYEKARKQKQDNVAIISDSVVYLWAITYFRKSNEELGIKENVLTSSTDKELIENTRKKNVRKENTSEEKKLEDNQITLFQEVQK